MGNFHIAHDCQLGITPFGKWSFIRWSCGGRDRVFVGGGAAVHQFVRIGTGVMVGGLAEISVMFLPSCS